jgi:hypothetical protein
LNSTSQRGAPHAVDSVEDEEEDDEEEDDEEEEDEVDEEEEDEVEVEEEASPSLSACPPPLSSSPSSLASLNLCEHPSSEHVCDTCRNVTPYSKKVKSCGLHTGRSP